MATTVDNIDDVGYMVDLLKDKWKIENTFSKQPTIASSFSNPSRKDLRNPLVMIYPVHGSRTAVGLGHKSEKIDKMVSIDFRAITNQGINGREMLMKIKAEIIRIVKAEQLAPATYQWLDINAERDFSGRHRGLSWYVIDVAYKHWGSAIR
jgi:hypothetical protein